MAACKTTPIHEGMVVILHGHYCIPRPRSVWAVTGMILALLMVELGWPEMGRLGLLTPEGVSL